MPGYGTLPATEGSGLLPWSWAEERLIRSHDFWLATVTPQGAPHLMPVWAVWLSGRLWFSSANGSRKARNLSADARCTVSTDNPLEPVVVQGRAERISGAGELRAMLAAENAKYHKRQEIIYARTDAERRRWREADTRMIVAALDRTEERVTQVINAERDLLADLARVLRPEDETGGVE